MAIIVAGRHLDDETEFEYVEAFAGGDIEAFAGGLEPVGDEAPPTAQDLQDLAGFVIEGSPGALSEVEEENLLYLHQQAEALRRRERRRTIRRLVAQPTVRPTQVGGWAA